jgi:hypothetical protein
MVASVTVGQTPGPVTLGGQWAFVANMSDGTVTQIERKTGKAIATISVADPKVLRAQGCAPDSVHAYYSGSWGWRLCDTPYAIGWDGSSLWALDNGNQQLVRIDPSTHQTAERVALPGMGWSVAFGDGKGPRPRHAGGRSRRGLGDLRARRWDRPPRPDRSRHRQGDWPL